MAIRTDIISVDWSVSPRIAWIDISVTECDAQDLYDTLRHLEAQSDAMDEDPIVDAGGGEPLGGGVYVGITVSLFNAKYAFAARPGPDWVICNMTGGNVVAFEDSTKAVSIYPREPTAYVSADRSSASSATTQEQTDIRFSSFDGGITVDLANETGLAASGVDHPTGTPRQPVDNITDGLLIAADIGLKKFYAIGDLPVSENIEHYVLIGESITKTLITLNVGALTDGVEVYSATVTGTLDGDTTIRDCVVDVLTYVNGTITECGLKAVVITLGGASTSVFADCYSVASTGAGIPTIDMGGSGRDLIFQEYSGNLKLQNLTGPNEAQIHMSGGLLEIDSTCTAGTIIVTGADDIVDNSGPGCTVTARNQADEIAEAVWAYERP